MSTLIYLLTRAMLALVALMAVDSITGQALAADPWNILAATALVIVADIIVYSNQH